LSANTLLPGAVPPASLSAYSDAYISRPAYSSLKNNIPTSLQELKGHPWPQNTPDFINVREVGEYIHSYVRKFDVEEVTKYDTRVEKLEKVGKKWRVESSTLIREGEERGKKVREVEVGDELSKCVRCKD
jgi:DNA repair ATPase RecN